jgi:hypothetical protein
MDKDLKSDRDYLRSVCEGLERLRIGNKSDIRESQIEAYTGVNRITSELNKYLFTLATLLIPIIFSLITIDIVRQKLNKGDSTLISYSLVFLLLSIIAGFAHMFAEYKFFKKWLGIEERKSKQWSLISFWPGVPAPEKIKNYINEYDQAKNRVDEISLDMEKESPTVYLILQGFCLFFGLASIGIIVFRLLP